MTFYAKVLNNTLLLCSQESDKVLESLPIIQAEDQHRSFILSTWVRSYEPFIRRLQVAGMSIKPEDYRAGESFKAEQNWQNTKVVVSPDDPYTVHAWVCGRKEEPQPHLWYVYVPPHLRLKGVGRGLVEAYCGQEYSVSLPWPTQPRNHVVSYNPWL